MACHALIRKPAILAIVAPEPVLHNEWLPCIECLGVNLEALLQIVRVHAFSPAVSKLLFHAASRKLQPRLVKERAKLVQASHPDENGRSIRDELETRFAFLQLVLSGYALLDQGRQKQQRNRQTDQKYFNRKGALFSCFTREWSMPVGCAPNRQEANNRNGSARSQSAESYRHPKQKWQREKKQSQIRS